MDFQSLQKLRSFLSIIFPAVGRHLITPELAKVLALDVNARLVVLCAMAPDFFVFSQLSGQPAFTFDCELVPGRLKSERAGEYFAFLGLFVEALTCHFGTLSVEDA